MSNYFLLHKYDYIKLMEDFVNFKINGKYFEKEFLKRWNEDLDKEKKEETFLQSLKYARLCKKYYFKGLISEEEYDNEYEKIYGYRLDNLFLEILSLKVFFDVDDYCSDPELYKELCKEPFFTIDEDELRRRVKKNLEILEAHKGEW